MQYMTNSTPKMKQLSTTHKSARFCDTDSRTHRALGSAQRSAQRRSRRAHRVIDVAIRRPIGCSRQHSVLALRLRVRLTASAYEVRGGLRLDEHALRDELERDGNRGRSAHSHGRHGVPSRGRPPARRPRTGREPSLRDAHLRTTALLQQLRPPQQHRSVGTHVRRVGALNISSRRGVAHQHRAWGMLVPVRTRNKFS